MVRLAMFTQLVLAQLFLHVFTLKTVQEASWQSYLGRRGVLEEDAERKKVKLAKHVAAEKSPPFQTKVPRIIVQSWMSDGFKDPTSLWVPKERADMMLTWLEKNPTYEYRLFDDEDVEAYVANNFDQQHLETLRSIKQGASQVDFWRVLVVLRDGGVYFDSDSGCKVPLDEWVDSQTTYVSGIGACGDFHQWGIIAAPGSCILKQTADLIMANVQEIKAKGKVETAYHGLSIKNVDSSGVHASLRKEQWRIGGTVGMGGPAALMSSAEKCFMDPYSLATTLPGLKVCNGDFFGGRTIFKGPGLPSTWSDALPLVNMLDKLQPCGQLKLEELNTIK